MLDYIKIVTEDSLDYEDLFCPTTVSSGILEHKDPFPLDATEPRLELELSNTDNVMAVAMGASVVRIPEAFIPAETNPGFFDQSQEIIWDEAEIDNGEAVAGDNTEKRPLKFMKLSNRPMAIERPPAIDLDSVF